MTFSSDLIIDEQKAIWHMFLLTKFAKIVPLITCKKVSFGESKDVHLFTFQPVLAWCWYALYYALSIDKFKPNSIRLKKLKLAPKEEKLKINISKTKFMTNLVTSQNVSRGQLWESERHPRILYFHKSKAD